MNVTTNYDIVHKYTCKNGEVKTYLVNHTQTYFKKNVSPYKKKDLRNIIRAIKKQLTTLGDTSPYDKNFTNVVESILKAQTALNNNLNDNQQPEAT